MNLTRILLRMDTVGKTIRCIVPSRPAILFNLGLQAKHHKHPQAISAFMSVSMNGAKVGDKKRIRYRIYARPLQGTNAHERKENR